MGSRVFKRVLALCLAMVLMIASSMAVMAAESSPGEGDIVPDPVIPTRTTFVIAKNNTIDLSYLLCSVEEQQWNMGSLPYQEGN